MTLLDVTDRARRPVQHGAILGGILLLLATLGVLEPPERRPMAVATSCAGVTLLVIATRISQRWDVRYKGHQIRYVNNALTGERLYVDDRPAGRGKLGIKSEIRATITDGDGRGDTVVARSIAGLLTFQCRIVVERAEPAATGAAAASGAGAVGLSDAALLDEVRRRGLS